MTCTNVGTASTTETTNPGCSASTEASTGN